jgi:hypothetical protein
VVLRTKQGTTHTTEDMLVSSQHLEPAQHSSGSEREQYNTAQALLGLVLGSPLGFSLASWSFGEELGTCACNLAGRNAW